MRYSFKFPLIFFLLFVGTSPRANMGGGNPTGYFGIVKFISREKGGNPTGYLRFAKVGRIRFNRIKMPENIPNLENWEEWEGELRGYERGGGGAKKKERKFGTGRKSQERKEKLVIGFSREKRREDLEAQLLESFPKEESDLLAYRDWVEGILKGEEVFSLEDVKTEAKLARGHGGQHVQKNLTAIEAVHLPTGLRAYNADERRQYINKERALNSLKEKVEDLAEKWRAYEKESSGGALSLFPEK